MVRRSAQRQRGKRTRPVKRKVLIGTEGRNKTERSYFKNFNQIQNQFIVKFSSGNSMDAMGIVEDVRKSCDNEKDFRHDALAFAVFDADLWRTQGNQIQEALHRAKIQNIEVILSNPCFEVWFVLHFEDGKSPYNSSNGVIDRLKQHVPDYKKNKDIFGLLRKRMKEAIYHAEQLREYHEGKKTSEQNPMTDVDRVVKLLCGTGRGISCSEGVQAGSLSK